MKLSLRSRLAAMALMIFLLAAVIVGAATITWRQVRSLRRHFSDVRIESFRIADYLQASVLNLNTTLFRFVLGHDPGDWQKFSLNSEKLGLWLGQERPSTPREREDLTDFALVWRPTEPRQSRSPRTATISRVTCWRSCRKSKAPLSSC